MKFPSLRRPRGNTSAMGHATAKYAKHPAAQHNRQLEAQRATLTVEPIIDPSDTVREAIAKHENAAKRQ